MRILSDLSDEIALTVTGQKDAGVFPGDEARGQEPESNVWSNGAYLIAAFVYVSLSGPVAAVCALGLIVLAYGSGAFHRTSTETNHALDHLGMHLSLPAVAAYALSVSHGAVAGLLLYVVLLAYGAVVVRLVPAISDAREAAPGAKHRAFFDALLMRQTQACMAVYGSALLASLLTMGLPIAAISAGLFGLGFALHGRGHDTPTGFGAIHAAWHVLTALALALPALAVLFG